MAFELVCPQCGLEADSAALEAERQAEPSHAPPPADDVPPPGKKMVRDAGVTLIVFGAIFFLVALNFLWGEDYYLTVGGRMFTYEAVAALVEVAVGIIGCVLAPQTGRAGLVVMLLGVLLFVSQIIGIVWFLALFHNGCFPNLSSVANSYSTMGFFIFGAYNGILSPVLFFLSGNTRRRAAY